MHHRAVFGSDLHYKRSLMRQVRIGRGGLHCSKDATAAVLLLSEACRQAEGTARERARPSQSFRLEPENDFNWPWSCKWQWKITRKHGNLSTHKWSKIGTNEGGKMQINEQLRIFPRIIWQNIPEKWFFLVFSPVSYSFTPMFQVLTLVSVCSDKTTLIGMQKDGAWAPPKKLLWDNYFIFFFRSDKSLHTLGSHPCDVTTFPSYFNYPLKKRCATLAWIEPFNSCLNIWATVLKMQHNTYIISRTIAHRRFLSSSCCQTQGLPSFSRHLATVPSSTRFLSFLTEPSVSWAPVITAYDTGNTGTKSTLCTVKIVFILHKLMCCCDMLVNACWSTLDLWLHEVGKKERKTERKGVCLVSAALGERRAIWYVCGPRVRKKKKRSVCSNTTVSCR